MFISLINKFMSCTVHFLCYNYCYLHTLGGSRPHHHCEYIWKGQLTTVHCSFYSDQIQLSNSLRAACEEHWGKEEIPVSNITRVTFFFFFWPCINIDTGVVLQKTHNFSEKLSAEHENTHT